MSVEPRKVRKATRKATRKVRAKSFLLASKRQPKTNIVVAGFAGAKSHRVIASPVEYGSDAVFAVDVLRQVKVNGDEVFVSGAPLPG